MSCFLNNYTNHYDSLSDDEKEKLFTYSWEERFMPNLKPPLTKKKYLTFVAGDLLANQRREEAENILHRGLQFKFLPEDDYPIHDFLVRYYNNGHAGIEKAKLYCEAMLNYINKENVGVVCVGDFYPNFIYCRDRYFEILIAEEKKLERYEELIDLFRVKGLLPDTEKGIAALNRMKSIYHQTSFNVEFEKDLSAAEFHAREVGRFDEVLSSEYLKKLSKAMYRNSEFQKSIALLSESIRSYPFIAGIATLKMNLRKRFQGFPTEEEIANLKIYYVKNKEAGILSPYDNKVIGDLYKEMGMLELAQKYYEKYNAPNAHSFLSAP